MNFRLVTLTACSLVLAACATAPKPLQGNFATVSPREAATNAPAAASVRWGGAIVEAVPGPDSTCFQMLSRPLDATGRPQSRNADVTDGRFIACRAGFYDPAVFAPGREVTFIGRVDGVQDTKIGEYTYKLPRMAADVVYLWPEVREVYVRPSPFYDPFWGPYWGPRWGRWGWW